MGEIGTEIASCRRSSHRVAAGAGFRHEHVARLALCSGVGGRLRVCELCSAPALENHPLIGDDQQRHMRVLQAAELGALPAIDAWPIDGEDKRITTAGYEVLFACQVRNPEGMDNILCLQFHAHGPPDWHVQFIGSGELSRPRIHIGCRPPPLVTLQPDDEWVGWLRRDVAGGDVAGHCEAYDHQDTGGHSATDEPRRAMLVRFGGLASPP